MYTDIPDPSPTWANDLRWQKGKIFGHIKLVKYSRPGTTEMMLQVTFDGQVFTSRIRIQEEERVDIPEILSDMVRRLDEMMEEFGYPSYEIQGV